jgi:hypothetical protein
MVTIGLYEGSSKELLKIKFQRGFQTPLKALLLKVNHFSGGFEEI